MRSRVVWRSLDGYINGLRVFEVVEHTGRWRVYHRGAPLQPDLWAPSEHEAKTAAETVAADMPDPQPAPPLRERRRWIDNEGPEAAPHPGLSP